MKNQTLLSSLQLWALYIGFGLVYIAGLFIPLMQNDSAQHASMAMKMFLNNDFLNIYKGENPYLDKPHLHFWLAAFSMKIFGISGIAYRIPAILCLFLGAFSTKKLAELLYENKNLAHCSALIFLSAQTIILSAHDVRTDAVLTGFIIFATWQLVHFIKKQNAFSALIGGLATAFAFSSKGLIGAVIIGFSVFSYLLYSREWKAFFSKKIMLVLVGFILGLLPILYAYHHQFGEEGIRFILLGQSVSRMTADGFAPNNSDYFFFFHTLLWVFLPFSLLLYFAVFSRTIFFGKTFFNTLQNRKKNEFLTLGTFWLVMLVFSASKFKLPHYLNGLIPVLSILSASYWFELYIKNKLKIAKILWFIQLFLVFGSVVGVVLLSYYFTEIHIPIILVMFSFIILVMNIFVKNQLFSKYILVSFWFSITINLFLNTHFYPVLTQYQGSLSLAQYVNKHQLNKEKIYLLKNDESWAFDFYTKRNTPRVNENELKKGDYLIIYEDQLKSFKRNYSIIKIAKTYRITRLSLKFLNPKTRENQLSNVYFIQIN